MMRTVTIPGSKSLTNRALLLAALAQGTSTLHHAPEGDDIRVMIQTLIALGVKISSPQKGTLTVTSTATLTPATGPLFLENSGTAVRFLTAILSHQPFPSVLDGTPRMRERPLHPLMDALTQLGATFETPRLPLKIHGGNLEKDTTTVEGNLSGQFVSALLMLGPLLPRGLTINLKGPLTSRPYVEMTRDMMKTFGATSEWITPTQLQVNPGGYRPTNITLEADASSAAPFWGAAALTERSIHIANLPTTSLQPDMQILKILKKMGAHPLKPLGTVEANDFPDGALTLAGVAIFAQGRTTLTGLHTLKLKESDRLTALCTELSKIGATLRATEDTLKINGNPKLLHDHATLNPHNDHRLAMVFGMIKKRLPNLIIENPECVAKSYPTFWEDFKEKNIVLTGMRGSGKTTLGRQLAAHLNRPFVDLDEMIEAFTGKSIKTIVEEEGWDTFRAHERTAAKTAADLDGTVIATGGGTLIDETNATLLKKNGWVILLTCTPERLREYLKTSPHRPPLTDAASSLEEIETLWETRKKRYHAIADAIVDTTQWPTDLTLALPPCTFTP